MKAKVNTVKRRGVKLVPAGGKVGECTRGPDVRHVGCGGAIWPDGEVYSVVNFGCGFRGGKFVIDRQFSRKPTGYKGFCAKCHKSGAFHFAGKAVSK